MNDMIIEPKPYEGSEPFCFVSYSHEMKHIVFSIIDKLQQRGVRIWYDNGLKQIDDYYKKILQKIRDCSCFIVFYSKQRDTNQLSDFVTNEVYTAYTSKKTIISNYIDGVFELPGKLVLPGISNLHAEILTTGEHSNDEEIIASMLNVIPYGSRSSCYSAEPYSEDQIDTTLRRCPLLMICDLYARDISKAIAAAISVQTQKFIKALTENSIVFESVDISLVSNGAEGPVLLQDFAPLNQAGLVSLERGQMDSAFELAELAENMLDNIQSFYTDIGVSSYMPIVVLLTDINNRDCADYVNLEKLSKSDQILSVIIPARPYLPENSAGYFARVPKGLTAAADFELTINAFSKLTEMVYTHLGVAPPSPNQKQPGTIFPGRDAPTGFRQRKISQIKEEDK